jgi:hypothetical protein
MLQGCGYPPDVDCDMYAEKYENYSLVNNIRKLANLLHL